MKARGLACGAELEDGELELELEQGPRASLQEIRETELEEMATRDDREIKLMDLLPAAPRPPARPPPTHISLASASTPHLLQMPKWPLVSARRKGTATAAAHSKFHHSNQRHSAAVLAQQQLPGPLRRTPSHHHLAMPENLEKLMSPPAAVHSRSGHRAGGGGGSGGLARGKSIGGSSRFLLSGTGLKDKN